MSQKEKLYLNKVAGIHDTHNIIANFFKAPNSYS